MENNFFELNLSDSEMSTNQLIDEEEEFEWSENDITEESIDEYDDLDEDFVEDFIEIKKNSKKSDEKKNAKKGSKDTIKPVEENDNNLIRVNEYIMQCMTARHGTDDSRNNEASLTIQN